jgi:hypothetical protein
MISQPTLKQHRPLLSLRLIIFHAGLQVVLLEINRFEIAGGKIIGVARAGNIGRGLPAVSFQELVLDENGEIRRWQDVAAEPQSLQDDPDVAVKGIHRAVKVLHLVILDLDMVDPESARLEQEILIS